MQSRQTQKTEAHRPVTQVTLSYHRAIDGTYAVEADGVIVKAHANEDAARAHCERLQALQDADLAKAN